MKITLPSYCEATHIYERAHGNTKTQYAHEHANIYTKMMQYAHNDISVLRSILEHHAQKRNKVTRFIPTVFQGDFSN
jgi:hypothetical protein